MIPKNVLRCISSACLVALSVTSIGLFVPISASAASSTDFEKGLAAARSGQMELAVKLWSKSIQRQPKSYAAYVNRGLAYIHSGRVFEGVTDWHKARELAPVFAYGVYTGDFILEASGNPMLSFAAPLELEPEYVASVFMTAVTYLDVGRADKASELYRKSIDLTTNPLLKSYLDHWAASLE